MARSSHIRNCVTFAHRDTESSREDSAVSVRVAGLCWIECTSSNQSGPLRLRRLSREDAPESLAVPCGITRGMPDSFSWVWIPP